MLLKGAHFFILVSMSMTTECSGVLDDVVRRRDLAAPHHEMLQQASKMSSSQVATAVAESRRFRRAFRRSLMQIFDMKTWRPRRQRATSGADRVPAYMRWLYGESSAGRLHAVLRHLNGRRSASPQRQKRHSQLTANTVRSFTGIFYASNTSVNFSSR